LANHLSSKCSGAERNCCAACVFEMASKKRTLFDFEFRGGIVKKKKDQLDESRASVSCTSSSADETTTAAVCASSSTEAVPAAVPSCSTSTASAKEHKFQDQWIKKWPWWFGMLHCCSLLMPRRHPPLFWSEGGQIPPFFSYQGGLPPLF